LVSEICTAKESEDPEGSMWRVAGNDRSWKKKKTNVFLMNY